MLSQIGRVLNELIGRKQKPKIELVESMESVEGVKGIEELLKPEHEHDWAPWWVQRWYNGDTKYAAYCVSCQTWVELDSGDLAKIMQLWGFIAHHYPHSYEHMSKFSAG